MIVKPLPLYHQSIGVEYWRDNAKHYYTEQIMNKKERLVAAIENGTVIEMVT